MTPSEPAKKESPTYVSLRARTEAVKQQLKATGNYKGISDLRLKERDVIRFELLYSRLQSIVIGSQLVGSKVACSPGTREVGESVVGLYTPEGDSVVFSGGIMVHVHTMSRFIKWMIAHDYETNPGFKHGDIFENNDTYIGGVHIPDIMDVTPIYWDGELIGWTGMVTHVLEVGGITPGSMPVLSAERFTEGLIICAEKVGENDQIFKHYEVRAERSVRSPDLWILDAKARVTGALMARDEIVRTIKEFGIDYYNEAVDEYIESARRAQLDRVKTMLVPGVYKEVTTCDQIMEGAPGLSPLADGNVTIIEPLEMTIDGAGKMMIDFDGFGSWRYWSGNATPAALEGGFFVSMSQALNFDGRINHGSYLATELKFPQGTTLWPDNKYASTSLGWNLVMPTWANWYRMMARATYMRGFVEETFLFGALTPCYDAGGIDQYGRVFGGTNFELAAQGSGARGIADGIDFGYVLWNPESDMGNAEIWEQLFPQLYLSRKILPNAHGFGKYRGGNGWQSLLLTHNSNQMVVTTELCQARAFDHQGIFGGYPGKVHYIYLLTDTDIKERIANFDELPTGEGDDPRNPDLTRLLKGKLRVSHGNMTADKPLKDGDVLLMQYRGMGGFGDPLDRDVVLIEQDLENGIVTRETAEKVCGAVIERSADDDRWIVNRDATEKRRAELRLARISNAIPAKKWMEAQKTRIVEHELPDVVLEIYKDVSSHSKKWMREYRNFWGLDDTFTFDVPEIRDVNPFALRTGESRVADNPLEF
jgi:N-methylhydantoinase B/oxoprolinase/acetone carboxylase alpha subunit